MINTLILKLTNYSPVTDGFAFLLDIITSPEEESKEFRTLIDEKCNDIEISNDAPEADKIKKEIFVVHDIMTSLPFFEGIELYLNHSSGRRIVNITPAGDYYAHRAWLDDKTFFYISSLTDLKICSKKGDFEFKYQPKKDD